MSLKNKFHVNPVDLFFAKHAKTLILTYDDHLQCQKGPENIALETYTLHSLKKFEISLENQFRANPVKTDFDLILALIESQRAQKYGPWVPIFHTLVEVVPVSFKTTFI